MTRDLIQNAEAYADRLARRIYSREGIEMLLALEDLSAERAVDVPAATQHDGVRLAVAVQEVAARLLAANSSDPVRTLRLALEIVAFQDFGLGALTTNNARDPIATGEGRRPLALTAEPHEEAAQLVRALTQGRFVRSVNFHNTFAADRDALRDQLRALRDRFTCIGLAELERLVAGEPWSDAHPPLLLVFYEGTRNHYDVAAPLLKELGLTGIFCLIPGFNDLPVSEQVGFAPAHEVAIDALEYADGRVAMTWDEVRSFAADGHSFVCHTMTHARPDQTGIDLARETGDAVRRIADELNQSLTAFVWQGGFGWGAAPRADAHVSETGVRLLLSNFKAQRLPRTHAPR